MQVHGALVLIVPGLVLFGSPNASPGECNGPPATCPPGLTEHGSIAKASVAPPLPTPKAKVPDGGTETTSPTEVAREATQPDDDLGRGLPAYDPHDTLFSSDLAGRVASLQGCRVEVARARRVKPTDLPDEMAHLRLWVAPDGRVTDSLVATEGAIGSAFLDCLKREVKGWQLLPPRTGKGAYVDVDAAIPAGRPAEISGPRPAPPP